MTTGATAGGSNLQNNATSNMNTGGGHFSHFGTIRANPFGGFEAFENNNNNNNNNNNPSPEIIITITYRHYHHYHY